jgi:hypothetical protein
MDPRTPDAVGHELADGGARSAVIRLQASGWAVPSSSWFSAPIRAVVIMPPVAGHDRAG